MYQAFQVWITDEDSEEIKVSDATQWGNNTQVVVDFGENLSVWLSSNRAMRLADHLYGCVNAIDMVDDREDRTDWIEVDEDGFPVDSDDDPSLREVWDAQGFIEEAQYNEDRYNEAMIHQGYANE